jgi:hypothetical protein
MDRWLNRVSGGGVITNQQTTSTVPTGFPYALALTVQTADASIAAGDVYELEQRIEGFNTQDLAWGTSKRFSRYFIFLGSQFCNRNIRSWNSKYFIYSIRM